MRVNVYAEELTDRVEIVTKTIEGIEYTGLRMYLYLPVTVGDENKRRPFLHHDGDDDSSAITIWGKKDLAKILNIMRRKLSAHYFEQQQGKQTPAQTLQKSVEDYIAHM